MLDNIEPRASGTLPESPRWNSGQGKLIIQDGGSLANPARRQFPNAGTPRPTLVHYPRKPGGLGRCGSRTTQTFEPALPPRDIPGTTGSTGTPAVRSPRPTIPRRRRQPWSGSLYANAAFCPAPGASADTLPGCSARCRNTPNTPPPSPAAQSRPTRISRRWSSLNTRA